MKMRILPSLVLGLSLFLAPANAHEGHKEPGALPPAPHGGVLGEAEHTVKHLPDPKETELFFEAKFVSGELELYALGLEATNTATFKTVAPEDVSPIKVKVEYPRTKKTEEVKLSPTDAGFKTKFTPKSPGRFIVHVSGTHNKEVKTAKLQVEPK